MQTADDLCPALLQVGNKQQVAHFPPGRNGRQQVAHPFRSQRPVCQKRKERRGFRHIQHACPARQQTRPVHCHVDVSQVERKITLLKTEFRQAEQAAVQVRPGETENTGQSVRQGFRTANASITDTDIASEISLARRETQP